MAKERKQRFRASAAPAALAVAQNANGKSAGLPQMPDPLSGVPPHVVAMVNEISAQKAMFEQRCIVLAAQVAGLTQALERANAAASPGKK